MPETPTPERCPRCEDCAPLVDDTLYGGQACARCVQASWDSWQRSEAARGPTRDEMDGILPRGEGA